MNALFQTPTTAENPLLDLERRSNRTPTTKPTPVAPVKEAPVKEAPAAADTATKPTPVAPVREAPAAADTATETMPPAAPSAAPSVTPSPTSYVPRARTRRPRNPEAPENTRANDERMHAEAKLRALCRGMPEPLQAALSAFDVTTGTADFRKLIAAILDLNDPRLIDVAKNTLVKKGAMTASAFNEIRKGIETERRERAKAADTKKQKAQGGCRVARSTPSATLRRRSAAFALAAFKSTAGNGPRPMFVRLPRICHRKTHDPRPLAATRISRFRST